MVIQLLILIDVFIDDKREPSNARKGNKNNYWNHIFTQSFNTCNLEEVFLWIYVKGFQFLTVNTKL